MHASERGYKDITSRAASLASLAAEPVDPPARACPSFSPPPTPRRFLCERPWRLAQGHRAQFPRCTMPSPGSCLEEKDAKREAAAAAEERFVARGKRSQRAD